MTNQKPMFAPRLSEDEVKRVAKKFYKKMVYAANNKTVGLNPVFMLSLANPTTKKLVGSLYVAFSEVRGKEYFMGMSTVPDYKVYGHADRRDMKNCLTDMFALAVDYHKTPLVPLCNTQDPVNNPNKKMPYLWSSDEAKSWFGSLVGGRIKAMSGDSPDCPYKYDVDDVGRR